MTVPPIPPTYHTLTPYLIVEGADKIVDFIVAAFDAREVHNMKTPDGKVMHADYVIGMSHVMISEATPPWPAMPATIHMYVPDTDTTFKKAIAAGAESVIEPTNMFYGDRSSGVKDPAGNLWWISTHIEDVSPEELARRSGAAAQEKRSQ